VRLERQGSNVYARLVGAGDESSPVALQIGERGFD
jgi:hypothetical protein